MALEGAQKLLNILFLLPVAMLAGFMLLKMVFEDDLPWWGGLFAMGSVLALLAIASLANSLVVTLAIMVLLASLMVFFPFALRQLANADLSRVDSEALDRAYQAYCARPESPAARIAVAMALRDVGLAGHAAVIIEQTVGTISTDIDPTTNTSLREMFRREEYAARRWREEAKPVDFHPVTCRHCQTKNEAGLLQCKKCGRLHLLDHVRSAVDSSRVLPKLVVAWALCALLIGGAVGIGAQLSEMARIAAVAGATTVVGLILFALFRPAWSRR
jgi:hypothetical protein